LTKLEPLVIARSLTDYIGDGRKVLVPFNVDSLEKPPKMAYHSNLIPDQKNFKLEIDRSGGNLCRELITGPLPYKEARMVLLKVFQWIRKNGWTTERCSVHANISFDNYKIQTKVPIKHLNVLKFCLDFNEKFVYSKFPNRVKSIYANSIKHLMTHSIFFTNPRQNQLLTPNEKYYGVNFQKMNDDYLEFRYLGCKDYEEKATLYLEMVDYFITFLYNHLMNPELTQADYGKMKDVIDRHKKILEVYKDPEMLIKNFPGIGVTVNLMDDIEVLKAFWGTIQDKVLEALLKGNMKKGSMNYDQDTGKMQIKDAEFDFCNITDFDLVGCKGYGYITQCRLFDCDLKNVILTSCWLVHDNHIESSKVLDCMVHEENTCKDCYIEAKFQKTVFDGKTVKGVWRSGTLGPNGKIGDDTEIIDKPNKKAKEKTKDYGIYDEVDVKAQYGERKFLKIQK